MGVNSDCTVNATPASRAARCGAMAGSNATGLTWAYVNGSEHWANSASASALRNPLGVESQPEATGFPAAVLKPADRAACNKPAATVVLPTSVSVPVMK
ncbi:hypothetical protein D3C84_924210 [compost metagenome]